MILSLLLKGVYIINCARGGIVDEEALLKGLNSGDVGMAALDVYTSEPPGEHLQELINHPNLVCTPHLGASTEEAQTKVAVDIAKQMCDVLDKKEVRVYVSNEHFSFLYINNMLCCYQFVGVLNVPYIMMSTTPHMQPFMSLAELMGSLIAQTSDSKIVAMQLRTAGGNV